MTRKNLKHLLARLALFEVSWQKTTPQYLLPAFINRKQGITFMVVSLKLGGANLHVGWADCHAEKVTS